MIRITASGILPALKQLLDNEIGSRIMFGTDQMLWHRPDALAASIGIAVNRVKKADFLTEDPFGSTPVLTPDGQRANACN